MENAGGRILELINEYNELKTQIPIATPYLWPDTQVSRAYRFHVLLLPGEEQPTFHRNFHAALRAALDAGYNDLTIAAEHSYFDVAIHYER